MKTATEIRCSQDRTLLTVHFNDGSTAQIGAELLRIESPSAEVQGHGSDTKITVLNKQNIKITAIHPVGNYAIRISFDDGHDTGIYSWPILAHFGHKQEELMDDYHKRVAALNG